MVYVEQNPSRAGMVEQPWQWRWSSAQAHLKACDDGLLDLVRWRAAHTPESWKLCLENGLHDGLLLARIHDSSEKGWPIGDEEFLDRLERDYGVRARPAKPGPKRSTKRKPPTATTSERPRSASAAS